MSKTPSILLFIIVDEISNRITKARRTRSFRIIKIPNFELFVAAVVKSIFTVNPEKPFFSWRELGFGAMRLWSAWRGLDPSLRETFFLCLRPPLEAGTIKWGFQRGLNIPFGQGRGTIPRPQILFLEAL